MPMTALATEPEPPTDVPSATEVELRRRLRTVVEAAGILRRIVPADDLLAPVEAACLALGPELERVTAAGVGREPLPADLEALDEKLGAVESALLAADAAVPMLLFRKRFDLDALSPAAVGRYAAFLAAHLGSDAERRDRIDLLVTRMVSERDEAGRTRMREKTEVAAFLRQVSGGQRLPEDRRTRAVRFFAEQVARLVRLDGPLAVFDSGLYGETYAFKLSLREGYLDPDVLYAAASFNVSLGRYQSIHRSVSRNALADAARRVKSEVQSVFTTERVRAAETATQRYERSRMVEKAAARTGRVTVAARHKPLPLARVVRVAAAVLVVAGGAYVLSGLHRSRQTVVDPTDLASLSPVLASGRTIEGASTVFVGAVDATRWKALDADARRETAHEIAGRLGTQWDIEAALVASGGRAAIQIDQGKVVFVQ